MQHKRQFNLLNCLAITLCILQTTSAQRPSYAGSRPTGLGQKDKYHISSQPDIGTRFGSNNNSAPTPAPNVVAFGASQRPPVGYPIVQPQEQYVPLAAPAPQPSVENRFGDSNQSTTMNSSAGAGAANNSNTNVRPSIQQPLPLPFDALGDQQLIDQLNRIPESNRPFWFLNYQAIEAHRNGSGPKFSGAVASNQGSFFG